MASPKRVSNQAFKLKKPEKPCETAQYLIPQVEAIDIRVIRLEKMVHNRLTQLTECVNKLSDRLDTHGI
jgi:hypothetical protein